MNEIYNGISDGVADGIAIEKGDTIYVVDSEKDSGEVTFGIRKRKVIHDRRYRRELIRRMNSESISKGYISDGLSSRVGDKYVDDWKSDR